MLFGSCQNHSVYEQYQAIDRALWEKEKIYYFTLRVDDITIPYNLSVEVRNNNQYPYQNVWLFCNEEPPVGGLKRDTMECLLADDYGKWYGQGISLYQSSFPIRTNYYFPYEGQYTFSFKQGMRHEALPGIQEIGFKVVHAAIAPSAKHPAGER